MKTLLEVIDLENEPNILNQIIDNMNQTKTMKARGRKPVADKKKPVILYLRQSKLLENGGEEATKQKLYDYLKVTALILICLFAHNFIQF